MHPARRTRIQMTALRRLEAKFPPPRVHWYMVHNCRRNRRFPKGGELAGKMMGMREKRRVLVRHRVHSLLAQSLKVGIASC